DRPPQQLDLVAVARQGLHTLDRAFGGLLPRGPVLPLTSESRFRPAHAPGLRADAAGGNARAADHAVVDVERGRNRDERELVGRAIAHFEVTRSLGVRAARDLDC